MFYTIMSVVLNILNIVVLIKGISFSIYEIKNNSNKFRWNYYYYNWYYRIRTNFIYTLVAIKFRH